ncbi:MAG: DUF3164 family protein [Gemmobacter sp.]|nr:DUF3164 family protein [Gemmobacter sp.]
MTDKTSRFEPHPVPPPTVLVDGKTYWRKANGGLEPVEHVKATDQLEDQTVRKIFGYALALSDQVSRFKAHTFEDLGDFDALLAQEYGLTKGGAKGNRTYTSFDGMMRVSVRVADLIDFGPGLQIAKALIDECINEWAAEARSEIRAIVTRAFNTDREGQINRSEIFGLLRHDITEPRWVEAMRALREAMRVIGSKTYVRIEHRDAPDGPWSAVTIDLARA